ncbi:hypothetical protein OAK19_01275 [Aureispira]|nr:hypothetical protein [Aureispira sp.]
MIIIESSKSQNYIVGVLISISTLVIFASVYFGLQNIDILSQHAFILMALLLFCGFCGYLFRANSVILINFLACITLCSFLKQSQYNRFIPLTVEEEIKVRVAHVVLDDEQSISRFGRGWQLLNADFVSIQANIQPSQENQMIKRLTKRLPYWKKTMFNDDVSMFVFSAYELRELDTLTSSYNKNFSLVGKVFIDSLHSEISFLSTRMPLVEYKENEIKNHLADLSDYIKNNCDGNHLLALSASQLSSWAPEVRAFKALHMLQDSQSNNKISAKREHIFYSKKLICSEYSEIYNGNGIIATYQLMNPVLRTAHKSPVLSSFAAAAL